MITLTSHHYCPLSFFSPTYFVSILPFPSLYFSLSSYLIPLFPKELLSSPCPFSFASLPLSLSIILIFRSSVTKPGPRHRFSSKTAGSVGLLHAHIGHFVTFNISVLLRRQERYITSLSPSPEFLIPSHFFFMSCTFKYVIALHLI